MRRRLLKAVNAILSPIGFELYRVLQFHDPAHSYMKDPYLRDLMIEEVSDIARHFFAQHLSHISSSEFDFKAEIERFFLIYSQRSFSHNRGGLGFHGSFWVFLISRVLNPSLIVESGVWKGQTTWLLEQACPDASIHGFDISLGHVEYKSSAIEFHEHDWTGYTFQDIDKDRSLVFFDCQVSHAKRIREAHERGFRHLLFGANPPIHKLFITGSPPFPTANMIFHHTNSDRREVSWSWKGEDRTYQIDPGEIIEARKLIEKHEVFPDVGGLTRYGDHGGYYFLTYAKLIDG